MYEPQWRCDLCGSTITKKEMQHLASPGDITVPGSNLRIRFAGLRVTKGEEDISDLCPDCRAIIAKCILQEKPWSHLSALPPSQRSALLLSSSSA